MRVNEKARDTVSISIGNVWARGDWTLQLDGETVASGTAEAPRTGSRTTTRREGNNLLIAYPTSPTVDLCLTWH
jgi:hypothetical protein